LRPILCLHDDETTNQLIDLPTSTGTLPASCCGLREAKTRGCGWRRLYQQRNSVWECLVDLFIAGLPKQEEQIAGLLRPELLDCERSEAIHRGGGPAVSTAVLDHASRLYLYRYWKYEQRVAEPKFSASDLGDFDDHTQRGALRLFPPPDQTSLTCNGWPLLPRFCEGFRW
jgi:hypothetical protein